MDYEEFQIAILRRPDNAPSLDPETQKASREAHRAYNAALREAGTVVANGGTQGQSDPSVKGMAIYAAASLDAAKELAAKDPAVVDGWLEPVFQTWRIPAGTMRVPGLAVE
jgi:uncharacterized protein YciI